VEREADVLARVPGEMLRVLLDARKLWDGGIGVYTENLIAGLLQQPGIALTLIVPPAVAASPRFARYPWSGMVGILEDASPGYSYDELFRFAQRIPFRRYDLYHVPHYTLPFGVPIPSVITVHDLIHIQHPERMYYPLIAKSLIRSALRRATRVLTVSQATLNELKRFYGRNRRVAGKLRLVPNSLDPYFLKDCAPQEYLPARFRLHGAYLMSVFSTLKPHKGLRDLLQAFHALKRSAATAAPALARAIADLKLVLVGQGMQHPAEVDRLLDHAGAVEDVYLFGAVSKEDLLNLYAGAAALVVPSLAEGFGLPVIEAQAQGTPVIARPVPALQELLTRRDTLCADFSQAALQRGLSAFIENHVRGETGKSRGTDLLRRFDRAEVARAVMHVYREAARRPHSMLAPVAAPEVHARRAGA